MNKARRHELKMLKYKKRMSKYKRPFLRVDGQWNTFAYRSHGSPCSCFVCQQPETAYNRAVETKIYKREIIREYEDLINIEG